MLVFVRINVHTNDGGLTKLIITLTFTGTTIQQRSSVAFFLFTAAPL